MDTCNYNFYPTYSGYELWPIYDSYGIYAPHYWSNHTTGTNVPVPQPILVPVPVPYFTPRHPVNCYGSMHNQVANERGSGEVSSNSAQNSCDSDYWGSHNSVSHEGNDQNWNNIEVQLVGNDSSRDPESTKPLEIEADNGEKDKSVKDSQVNYLADNGEKDQCVKTSQVNTKAKNGEKDHSEKISLVNAEHDTSEEINGVSNQWKKEVDSLTFCQSGTSPPPFWVNTQ
ncbi:uncharacterized protein LOC132624301 [Lycium barbarum]|uniref:uncharacterized protein LOC132624301 n=1 Tax=Lycium barbarum TaxID=112863 RepID=UPI00293EE34C|nr:uncharacterized protein LOC132624301 [Lycium barbarum]